MQLIGTVYVITILCLLKAFKQIEEKGLNVVGCTYGDIRDEKFFGGS